MSHEFESGFFVRDKAWHGLGTVLQNAPTDTAEAMVMAGLDWNVEAIPVHGDRATADGITRIDSDGHRMFIRSTDGSVLSIMGEGYTPLQNREAFRFFEPFLAEGDAKLEAAGSLKAGKVVWVLASIGATDYVGSPKDRIAPYLLLSNAHDGSACVRVAFTAIRVVCWNTLSAALRNEKGSSAKIRHTRNVEANTRAVRDCIDLARQEFTATLDVLTAMRSQEITIPALVDYVRELFASPTTIAKIVQAQKDGVPLHLQPQVRGQADIERLFVSGPGAGLAGRTAYGAYNAVTHYVDHVRGSSADGRLHSTWFGQGAQVRSEAFELASTMGTGLERSDGGS